MTSLRRLSRLRLLLVVLLPLLAGVVLAASGVGASLDNWLRAQRDAVRRHPASGQIVVVEIDAATLARIQRWPWPRSLYGAAVDRLSAAGADTIAFDVDFSSSSTPEEDARFADAIARSASMIVLPTFRQPAASGSDRIVENLPIAGLREHAFLGSVNVFTDSDGVLRRYRAGITTAGETRPSLASYLAATPGAAARNFTIDYAINPASLPQYSFVDVIEGRVAPEKLAGKRVVIGATAIELGDRYATPGYGILPGVLAQALAAETLLQGSANPGLGPWIGLLVGAVAALALLLRPRGQHASILTATFLALLALPLIGEHLRLATLDVAPALGLLLASAAGALAWETMATLRASKFTDDSGLPNRAAFGVEQAAAGAAVVSVTFGRAEDLAALIGAVHRTEAITRIVEKLSVGARGARIFRMDTGRYAWIAQPQDVADLESHLQLVASLFKDPIVLGAHTVMLRASFGWSHLDPAQDLAVGYTHATLAAQRAAQTSVPCAAYEPWMAEAATRTQQLLADIQGGIANDHFWVAYQPKLDLKTSAIIGAEALVRWKHPTLGAIGPDEFIPLLETEGAIGDLTWFVVDRVLNDLAEWARQSLWPSVAINVSTRMFDDSDFAERLVSRAAAAGVSPGQVVVEVTESAAVGSEQATIAELLALREAGFKISVDDYGTGQSTLAYLRNFPAHEIKIDQSFIRRIMTDSHDQILVRSTIDLAHALKLSVVAEGIEDQETLQLLQTMGCDVGQGWVIGKPGPAEVFAGALRAQARAVGLSVIGLGLSGEIRRRQV